MEFPDVELEAHTGEKISPARVPRAVVYFFPKAFTQGCTRETIRFNELYPRFRERGYEVFGVSTDDVETLKKFAEKYKIQRRETRLAARHIAAHGHGGESHLHTQRRQSGSYTQGAEVC
jgi:peroxiredoxin